ncbi:MAG: HlyD family efflux transporter periplasmic adaptor subunit [Synechococcales cyanobacterium RM1_1_8]|nr:HlyD family efflux transporter periplasmic adaptor subunit [Synechococcales cyanobacterium RM1_1_8]
MTLKPAPQAASPTTAQATIRAMNRATVQTLLLLGLLTSPLTIGLSGCGLGPAAESSQGEGQGAGRGGGGRGDAEDAPPTVEILQASSGSLDDGQTYTGSTEPRQQIEIKSQLTAQILSLPLAVGDRVTQGEVIAQLDPKLLQANLGEAQAELAVRQAELSQAKSSLAETQAAISQAEAELSQAQADGRRLSSLAQSGAIPQQQADQAQTDQRVAEQRLRLAQEQARTKQEAIAAAQQRLTAQTAVIAQEQERLALSQIQAPISGVVLARQLEAGDLAQAGQALLTLGDLQETQVVIEVTDQDRSKVALGQPVQVQLDAFPGQRFPGRVSQISPLANPASRLIPIEIALETSEVLGSGLLARVRLDGDVAAVSVPQSALEVGRGDRGPAADQAAAGNNSDQPPGQAPSSRTATPQPSPGNDSTKTGTIFILSASGSEPQVQAQTVTLGSFSNGQAEILAGLSAGDLYIAKSDQPLTDGQTVRRSLASEF